MAKQPCYHEVKDAIKEGVLSFKKWYRKVDGTSAAYFICLGENSYISSKWYILINMHFKCWTQMSKIFTANVIGTLSSMKLAWGASRKLYIWVSHYFIQYINYLFALVQWLLQTSSNCGFCCTRNISLHRCSSSTLSSLWWLLLAWCCSVIPTGRKGKQLSLWWTQAILGIWSRAYRQCNTLVGGYVTL